MGRGGLVAFAGPLSRGYDDSNWTAVDLPHDFIINGTYNQDDPGSGSSCASPSLIHRPDDVCSRR